MLEGRVLKFSWELTITAVVLAITCFALGYWQFTRYEGKKGFFEQVEKQEARGRQTLDTSADWDKEALARIKTSGVFDHEKSMVLMNRSMGNIPGVKLITPFKVEGEEKHILVDRGFISYELWREGDMTPYQPQGVVEIEGVVHPSQEKQFWLAPPQKDPVAGEFREQWFRIDTDKMAKQLPYTLLPVYVEQTSSMGEYPKYDPREVLPPSRHLNYTFQWTGFGLFTLFLAGLAQYRKVRPKRDS